MSRPSSQERLARARQCMPLGVAENYRFWGDDTVFIQSMKGATLTDCDGGDYVDFRLGYGPIILGYRDPRVDDAVIRCITERGTVCGFSSDIDVEVVELLKRMCPNVDKLRFANSGTEAVMASVRTARGFTGREKVVQVEGGFHGLYDEMMWRSDVENWDVTGDREPDIIPFGGGISKVSRSLTEFVPLNDDEAIDSVFAAMGEEIAAVVIEPIQGNCGSISSTPAYLRKLRDVCDQYGALLIMDEVKTGFRVAKGGAQELYGVCADLTTYAKAMGNGYPVAAFGGRGDVMDRISFDPGGVVHGGTYTANLIALSAAQATMGILAETDALATVDEMGRRIQAVLGRVFDSCGVEHCFAGPPSMFGVHFGSEVPQNYRSWKKTQSALYVSFAKNMIRNGLMLEPDSREPWFICEAHQDVDLGWLEDVAMRSMRAALEQRGGAR